MIEIRHNNIENLHATQAAYNDIFSSRGIVQRDSFYIWLIKLLKPEPGRRLIDISCGEGRLPVLAEAFQLKSIGLDFALSGLQRGKKSSPGSNWVAADGESLPLNDASVDYVTHIGSLEHYLKPESGMQEICRVLTKDGKACILLPNSFGLFGNFKHVLQKGDAYDDGQPLQRYNTRAGWHKMLVANGLVPYKTLKYEREWPLTRADLVWYLRHPAKVLRLFVQYLIPLNLANCIVYLCHRAEDVL